MTIEEQISSRNISEVLHFTTNRGLVGILGGGRILSRRRLPKEKYLQHVAFPNARFRPEDSVHFDRSEDWLDFVNLSISEINAEFFRVSERWHQADDIWWALCGFSSELLTHNGVYFATTNNKYDYCVRRAGPEGFSALFEKVVPRKSNWVARRGNRDPRLPTCQQAEALYPQSVPLDFLRRVYVRTGDQSDVVKGWRREFGLPAVEVVIDETKFVGIPN